MAALPMLVAPRQQYLLGPATWSLPFAASPWRAMHGAALSLFNRFAHTQLRTRVEVGASLAVDQSQVDANVARGCAPCASRLFRTAGGVVASRLPSAGAVGVGHGARARCSSEGVNGCCGVTGTGARKVCHKGSKGARRWACAAPVARASGSVGKCGVFGGGMAEDSFWGAVVQGEGLFVSA
ncbi:hypothetical protein ERJ75_001555200 [Trypanosoma vivax]|nr:hypothetical protein ERJ75_001555200 [Trypanosoma vivax]